MENLQDTLEKLAGILHFLGKYYDCRIIMALIVFCRKNKITTLEELEEILKRDI